MPRHPKSHNGRRLLPSWKNLFAPPRRSSKGAKLSFESLEKRELLAITPLGSISTSENTGEKPQSKLWEHEGQWWAALPHDDTVWISRLDGTNWTRVLSVGDSDGVHVDVKANGDLAHLLLVDGNKTQFATIEYSSITNSYRPWELQPDVVDMGLPKGIETATIDVDSTGRMWVAYDQGSSIEVRYADGVYDNWSAPIVVASGISSDDISVISALPDGKVGVMWSNQKTRLFGFRYHVDGTSPTEWSGDERPASQSADGKMADDHLNVAVTSNGTLYAAVKTSYDSSSRPAIALLVRRPNGQWDNLYSVDTKGTRPIVIVNEEANRLVVAYTISESGGDIVYKESRLDQISFGPRQVMISGSLNNVTSTKQTFEDGVVLMASRGSTARAVYFSFDTATPNQAPQVDAGPNRNVTLGTPASLDGTVSDDGGLPSLTLQWSKVSGPGTVTFGNAANVDTTASFSQPGTYVLQLTASDGSLTSSDTMTVTVAAPANMPPVVNAGPDQTLPMGAPATLSGTVTDDGFPGSTINTQWSRVAGPGSVAFGNPGSPNTSVQFSAPGTYILRLTANDGQLTASDDITITIQPVVSNQVPVVNAGNNQTIVLGNSLHLAGSVVDDSAPSSLAYTWSRVSGPGSVSFGNATALNTTAQFSTSGTYVLQLTVSDGQFSASDTLTVTVTPNSAPLSTSFQDGVGGYQGTRDTMIRSRSSNSTAGNDSELSMDGNPDQAVLLAWDIASIPAGSIIESATIELYVTNTSTIPYAIYALGRQWDEASATWSQPTAGSSWSSEGALGSGDRGPLVGHLVGTRKGSTTVTLNAAGLAMVQAWINDPASNFGIIFQDYGASNGLDIAASEASNASQRPKLTISYRVPSGPAPNEAPVVEAGPDRSTTVGSSVSLAGSVTDDGQPSPVTSTWTRVSGPGTVTFGSASSPSTTAQFSTPGTYVLRLTATDGSLTSSDEMRVTVSAAPLNHAPSVDAGSNQTVTAGTVVNLQGTVSDDGLPGANLTTAWAKVSGPGGVTFGNVSDVNTTAQFSASGTYVLRLTASDGQLSTSDTLTITVNPQVVNTAPNVDAGSNQTVTAGTVVNLQGTVSDDGLPGANLTTAWAKVSGPGSVTFGNAANVDTTAQFSAPGTYVLRLTASDGQLSTSDSVTITVNPQVVNTAPNVDAGSNLTVTVGSNLWLNGTVTDDGFPGPLSTQWSKVSGPGNVQFASATAVDTHVSFSAPGNYVLRLSANDGALGAADDILVTVVSASVPITAEFQQGVDGYNGTRDTMIESGSSSGAGNDTELSMDGRPDSGVLIGWDLSAIPSGSIIVSASIEFYITNTSKDTYDAFAVNRAWDELAATWSRATESTNWSSAGAQGSTDRGQATVGQLSGSRKGTTEMQLNELGLALVQAWIDDPASNHGLIFANYSATNGLDFASSEASNVSQRPKLKIEFEPPLVQHSSAIFFAPPETPPSGSEQAIYPYGSNMAFGLYSVSGRNNYDPSKTNMQRVAEQGFNLVGPYNSFKWETDLTHIQAAHALGLQFIFQVRQHPSLNGVGIADRPAAIGQLSDSEIAAFARTQVEAILNDPVARETVAFWTLQPEEVRHWIPEEMRYLRIATETIRQVEAERGETARPIWMYEPNHRSVDELLLTGQYQDVVSKGTYMTTRYARGTQRAGWAMWSFEQVVEAAHTLGSVPQAIFQLYEDFTDPLTSSAAEIARVIRHDVYLGLVMGIEALNVFSMFENRPNLTTHNEQFEAYGSIARDLLGPLGLSQVLLTGEERTDLEIKVAGGPAEFAYEHTDGSSHTFKTLHYRNIALGDERYIFLVNSTEVPMEVEIAGLPGDYVVDDLFAGTTTTGQSTTMPVSLDVLGVKVLRLRQA